MPTCTIDVDLCRTKPTPRAQANCSDDERPIPFPDCLITGPCRSILHLCRSYRPDNQSRTIPPWPRFIDKIVVVTGASKGIGAGIAKRLASEGATIVVNYASGKDGANRVVEDIIHRGGKAVAVAASVSNEDDVARLFEEVSKAIRSCGRARQQCRSLRSDSRSRVYQFRSSTGTSTPTCWACCW